MKSFSCLIFVFFCSLSAGSLRAQVGSAVQQVIVARAPDWKAAKAKLQAFERPHPSAPWQPVFERELPVLLGRSGLAWGRGVFTPPRGAAPVKVEKDRRAPAGVFQLGTLFGYAPQPPAGSR